MAAAASEAAVAPTTTAAAAPPATSTGGGALAEPWAASLVPSHPYPPAYIDPLARPLQAPQNDTENIRQVTELLGRRMRIEVEDGRVLTGFFTCLDGERNIILREAIELKFAQYPKAIDSTEMEVREERRSFGLCLVPGGRIRSIGVAPAAAAAAPAAAAPTKAADATLATAAETPTAT